MHNGPAAGGAMPDESLRGSGSAIHAALMPTLPALMTTLTRLLRRLLLAATLLLLAGLLPAATLLLTRTRVALLRLARLRLVRVAHTLSPQGLTGPTPLVSTHGTAESCGARRAMRVRNSRDVDANFRQNFAAN